ncbi:MAG: polysaccharide export protein [Sphingomonadales bacterium]|nr:polysaccharide export protein [Sphingomonadales bacterium]
MVVISGRGAHGRRRAALLLAACALLSGCATLPISGPTGSEVEAANRSKHQPLKFKLVEVEDFAVLPRPPAPPPVEFQQTPPPPSDLIGPDDVLDIAIYEAGVTLFSGPGASVRGTLPEAASNGAQAEHLPLIRVDDEGYVRLPYAGRLRAAGHTPAELAHMIRDALRGMSQDPQVVVNIQQTIANSVIVGGEVTKPGRLVLTTNRETLSDAIALAGGYHGEARDLTAQVVRRGQSYSFRLSDVLSGPSRDMPVLPGDRIEVVSQPLTFAVMGASGKVDQMPFPAPAVSLAEAVAMAGGANPGLGDAKAVFVFRFQPAADGTLAPVVYHINMMRAGAFFLSQRFEMRDKDVLYIGNAASNQPSKLINLISQLFTPVVGVESGLIGTGVIK